MLDKQKNRGEPQPYLRNVNVRWFEFDLSDLLEMPFETSEQERYSIRKGDLVICEGGYPGRCAIWEDDEPVFFQKALHRVRCHEPERAKWVQYFLWMSDANGSLRAHFTGSGIQHLTGQALARLNIPLPPLEEQRRIVTVLDEAFAAIATATANAEKNLTNARELFENSLPGAFASRGEARANGALGEIGGEVFTGPFGSVLHKSDYVLDGIPLVNPAHIEAGKIVPSESKTVSAETADRLSSYRMDVGDIVFGRRGEIGRCAVVGEAEAGWLCGTGSFFIRPFSDVNPHFLAQLLRSPDVRAQLESLAAGATMLNLSNAALAKLPISLPDLNTQNKRLEEIEALARKTANLRAISARKLAALARLKQSLLHRAFSGELTSKAAEVVALNDNFATPEFAAKIVAFAYEQHVAKNRVRNFGTVKAEKILHMVEAIGGIDLGRQPSREAAGPDDAKHRHATWDWARSQRFFRFNKRSSGGHDFEKLSSYSVMIEDARTAIVGTPVEKAIELLVDMDRDFAELIATTYAAWNNLIRDQHAATDSDIVIAARDNWHRDKLRFDPSRFHDAIRFIRNNSIVPDGTAKRVGGQEALLF